MIPSSKQISNNMLEQWILPVFDTNTGCVSGQCFIIDSYLITAAHIVIDLSQPYVCIGENKYELNSKNASYVKYLKKEDEDCAIFRLPYTYQSPLQLADKIDISQEMNCYYVRERSEDSIMRQLKVSNVQQISVLSDKAILCHINPMLYEGDSGCPIITANNEVVGMLAGSTEDSSCSHICAFQSAVYVKKIIEQCLEN